MGSWRHHGLPVCSLCLCQALVVVWGPGVITGSLCVLCVCARPWWWCGVLASSRAPCVFFVSVPGLGGGVGSWRHHGLPVCSLCLCQALVVVWGPGVITGSLCVLCVCARPWWWCGVLESSRAPCVFSSSSASVCCPRPRARPSPWRSRTSKPGTRRKRRKRRGAKTRIRQQHKATAWRSRTSKPGTHRRNRRRQRLAAGSSVKPQSCGQRVVVERWNCHPSPQHTEQPCLYHAVFPRDRERSGKWSDNANGLKFLTIIIMKCL